MFGDLVPVPGRAVDRAATDALATVRKMENGGRWHCNRVQNMTDEGQCVARLEAAREMSVYSPCLECSKVLAMLRKTKTKEEIIEMARPQAQGQQKDNPFSGPEWKQYQKQARVVSTPFVSIRKDGVLSFSQYTTEKTGLKDYQSVDIFNNGGKRIGLVFNKDGSGTHKLTTDDNAVSVSIIGLLKSIRWGFGATQRYGYMVHAPGIIEIDLQTGRL